MGDIHKLRQEYRDKLASLESLIEAAEAAGRDLTEEEQRQYDALDSELRSLRTRIERLEELRAARDAAPEPAQPDTRNAPRIEVRDYDETDFRSFGEFIYAVRFRPDDQRLRGLQVEDRADLQMSSDALGGHLVPDQFRADLFRIQPREAVVRPRAFVIPAGSPPDATIRMPALDQSGTKGVYAGVTVSWIAEGAEKPETNPTFTDIELEPHEVAAHTVVTDKLLRNAPVADAVVRQLLRQAIIAAEDVAFLTGDGDGKPTGLIGHTSNVTVNRETADQISYSDVVQMYSRFLFGGDPVWLASQTVLPQLMQMTDAAGQLIWQPNARDDAPGTLLGIPVVVSNRMPTLGNKGDLVLADLNYYLIKDGSPLAISASEHVHFTSNKTVIKAFWMVDGKPAVTSPLQDEDGTTVSPFVVLDVPAV